MSFKDSLNKPLPSKAASYSKNQYETDVFESTTNDPEPEKDNQPEIDDEDPGNVTKTEGCGKEGYCGSETEGLPEISDAIENPEEITTAIGDVDTNLDFDPDSLSDEELDALDRELSGNSIDDEINADVSDVKLEPEEEIKADDMMQIAATPIVLNDQLSAEEKTSFAESVSEIQILINEGFLLESDVVSVLNTLTKEGVENILTESKNYNKKMLIRLDKEAKMKQLYALAVNVSAAAHNDPEYHQYKKILRARKIKKARLEKKYHNEAMKRMKIYFKRLTSSKSGVLSKIGHKLQK